MNPVSEPTLALVILAAGESQRFGTVKQLVNYRGKPLLQHTVDACVALPQYPTHVVVGAAQERILQTLDFTKTQVLVNDLWSEGIASSIRVSVEQLGSKYDALLFVAADQLKIGVSQLDNLINPWRNNPERLVSADYCGQVGIPAIFPRSFFPELKRLKGDTGGKKILLRHEAQLLRVNLPEASIDIDFPSDLV